MPRSLQAAQEAEARSLAAASFGVTLLHTIGGTYRESAEIELGNFFEGTLAKMRASGAIVKSSMAAASAALKVLGLRRWLFFRSRFVHCSLGAAAACKWVVVMAERCIGLPSA